LKIVNVSGGPSAENSLPHRVQETANTATFKRQLETVLFRRAFVDFRPVTSDFRSSLLFLFAPGLVFLSACNFLCKHVTTNYEVRTIRYLLSFNHKYHDYY